MGGQVTFFRTECLDSSMGWIRIKLLCGNFTGVQGSWSRTYQKVSVDWGWVDSFYTYISPTSGYSSTSIENNIPYGGNVTYLSNKNIVIINLSNVQILLVFLLLLLLLILIIFKRSVLMERKCYGFCTEMRHYSGVNSGYLPFCNSIFTSTSTYVSTSNVSFNALLSVRQIYPYPGEDN